MLIHLLELNEAGLSCMGRDMNTGNVGVTVCEYTNVYLELDLQAKCNHSVGLWGNLFLHCNVLERVICASCRCVVVIYVVLCQ